MPQFGGARSCSYWAPSTASISGQVATMRPTNILRVLLLGLCAGAAVAETGENAWLRYVPLDPQRAAIYDSLPATVIPLSNSSLLNAAQTELVRGVHGMLGRM